MWPDDLRPWYGSFVSSQARSLQRLGVDIEVVYIPGYKSRAEYLRGALVLHKALRRTFDVVHAHYGHSAVIAALQTRAPLVISFCGDDLLGTPNEAGHLIKSSQLMAAGFAQLARRAKATITKSEAMAMKLPRGCRRRNHVIPNGVDLNLFAPTDSADARLRLGWSTGMPNVLFVGNPELPRKNFALAQRVCAELARRGRPVHLRVASQVEPVTMPTWMSASDALLFTSLSEGSPNAIKEAMAAELPIVSAPVGDVRERLAGISGTYVVERNVAAMADALMMALDGGRTAAARRAIQALSIERVGERVLDVYRQVAG